MSRTHALWIAPALAVAITLLLAGSQFATWAFHALLTHLPRNEWVRAALLWSGFLLPVAVATVLPIWAALRHGHPAIPSGQR